jgi:GT2 family glycosyltransferase
LGTFVVNLDQGRRFTAARARNEGFAALKALSPNVRFVQFVDGDCEVDGGWIETAATFMQGHPDVAVVCGRRRERFPDKSIYNSLCDIEWNTACGETSSCGGDSMVRVDAFERVGGFRPGLMAGEEPEMCARLRERGWKIWRVNAEMTCHDVNILRFGQWWRRVVRSGYGYAEICRLSRRSPFPLYVREAKRAVLWGGLLPAALIGTALIYPFALAAVLVYPLQIIRIAYRRGPGQLDSWSYAFFIVVAKFAEFQGVTTFFWQWLLRQNVHPIEYKNAGN